MYCFCEYRRLGDMKVKLILPALAEAESPFWRPIKYSLFPPLGLATLAAYLSPEDEVDLQDQHVEELNLDDEPDLVLIQVYITNAYRAYRIADHYRRKGAYVLLGGLHVTSLPEEAAAHADTILLVREKIRSRGFWRISEISVHRKFIHLPYVHLKNYLLFVVIL